jgi:glycosyltransferase involved in cell wall biosynthesis
VRSVCFVATTPFVVNPFLTPHMNALANTLRVSLCTHLGAYPLTDRLDARVAVFDVPLARQIAPVADLRALWRLLRIFRAQHFDAVHSITPKAGLLAMLAAWLAGIPHRHHTFTGQVWATRRGWRRMLLRAMDRLIVAAATRVFADSPSQSRFLEVEQVAAPGAVAVLGRGSICGVDGNRFRPDDEARRHLRESLGTPADACVFLFVGRVTHEKGIGDLVDAFNRAFARESAVELWVVGPDEEHLQEELQQATIIGPQIRWLGPTFEPERYMAAADVLTLPSHREGFGMVIIEAAACGLPAIAYRIDGIIDAVVDGHTGQLVPPGSVPELAGQLARMAADPDARREMGRRARERASRDFSQREVTAAWVAFYATVLKE